MLQYIENIDISFQYRYILNRVVSAALYNVFFRTNLYFVTFCNAGKKNFVRTGVKSIN